MASNSFFGNSSLSLPSSSDFLMAFPRFGSSLVDFLSLGFGEFPWSNGSTGNDTSQVLATAAESVNSGPTQGHGGTSTIAEGVWDAFWKTVQYVSNFDGIFSYLWSRWAMTTILVAIVLNRAHVFSATREPVHLNLKARSLLRIVPVVLLLQQLVIILQTLNCQTGYHLPQLRFQNSDTAINKTWAMPSSYMQRMASALVFWQSAEDSCLATGMIPRDDDTMNFHGSSTILWPLFVVLATSQLVETVSSALRGQQPRPETGMSIFEHSLAFAEAETIARAAAGIGLFGLPKNVAPASNPQERSAAASAKIHSFTRVMILQRLNVPPEVLMVSLISCCSHLSSQLLAIAGLQHRFRLINTGVWGFLFLMLFFHSFINYARPSTIDDVHVIRYPTVCIIGFIPHMLTILGAFICSQVYMFALLSALLSSPRHLKDLSFREKLVAAHRNMSASASWSSISVSFRDDFYHFLLRAGYQMVIAAAEAVYFNEGLQVTLNPETWLEKARYDEAIKSGHTRPNLVPLELQEEFAEGDGFGLVDEAPQLGTDGLPLPSGYARERKTMRNVNKSSAAAIKEEGVGIAQRSGRWFMSLKLLEQTAELVGYCVARMVVRAWEAIGRAGHQPPSWLLQAARIKGLAKTANLNPSVQKDTLKFYRLTSSGALEQAQDGSDIDVETETRRRLAMQDPSMAGMVDMARLDSHLYSWWKAGGWWGEVDRSSDYQPSEDQDEWDTTSMMSGSATGWETASESSDASNATVVPARRTRHVNPAAVSDLSIGGGKIHLQNIANLLDPKSLEQKQEGRLLAQRLRSMNEGTGPITRSMYRRKVLQERLSALPGSSQAALLTPDDEALMLQHLITSRRAVHAERDKLSPSKGGQSWREGGAGMGEGGPQCAVCHSSPRTVLVWPCRCLSLCEECRVTLAESNFATCVCCRRDVSAFSRLFVP